MYNDANEINGRLKYKIEQTSVDSKRSDIESIEDEAKAYKENVKAIASSHNSLTIKDNNLLREASRIYKENILPLEESLNDLKFKRREFNVYMWPHKSKFSMQRSLNYQYITITCSS